MAARNMDGFEAARIMYGQSGGSGMVELNIHQKIHAIMNDVSYVQKEDKKVNNQYKFVSHDAVTSKVRPALLKHGVLAVPSYFNISSDGNRTNCSMSMILINIDKPEDRLEIPCAGFGQGIDPQDKGAGKAMSYAYKYALLKIFALETGDDPEKDDIDYTPKAPNPPKTEPTPEQKLAAATKATDKYLAELEDTPAEFIISIDKKHEAMLERVNAAYPELAKKIKDAVALKHKEAADLLNQFKSA